jgi:hypothetical protein
VDWRLLAAIARSPLALTLLVVAAVAAGDALASGSLLVQVVAALVAVGAFCLAVRTVRKPKNVSGS